MNIQEIDEQAVHDETNCAQTDRQILSFKLDDSLFGIEISSIQEVLEYSSVSKVPRTPSYMLGVINLRGKVIPVVDLRKQFDMHQQENDINSCIIIIHVEIDNELTVLGILADRVYEVVEIKAENINPAPQLGNKIDASFIEGMAKHNDDFVIIMDVARIFSEQEMQSIQSGAQETENMASNQTDSLPQSQLDADA